MPPGGSNTLITAQETADRLAVPVKTLLRFRDRWGVKWVRVGRGVRFRERDLEAWIADNEQAK